MLNAPTLYDQIIALNVPTDSHESDLYVLATPEVRALLDAHGLDILKASGRTYSTFTSNIDGRLWFDVPFAYQPWWDKRGGK